MDKSISLMFKELCCSRCKEDFGENSIKIISKDKDFLVINLVCKNCGKNFGTAFLKLTDNLSENIEDMVLKDSRNFKFINFL